MSTKAKTESELIEATAGVVSAGGLRSEPGGRAAIRTADATEQGHHSLSFAQGQLRLQHETCMPAGRSCLEAFVLLVSHLEQQQQGV